MNLLDHFYQVSKRKTVTLNITRKTLTDSITGDIVIYANHLKIHISSVTIANTLTNSVAYGTLRFNVAFTRAPQ